MKNKLLGLFPALILIISCLTSTVSYAASSAGSLNTPEMESTISEFLKVAPGIAVSEVCGAESYCNGYGYDSIKDSTMLSETSHFEIASISKEFTALSVLLLQEEGKLSIEDSVSDYLPWFNVSYNGSEADIKIWHLLNHCSGLPSVDKLFPIGDDDSLKEETVKLVDECELIFEPGDHFYYNNIGFDFLAFIVETVSGQSFSEYVTEEILKPVGMTNSGFDIPTVQGYREFYGTFQPYDAPRLKGNEAAGYLIVTPEDMVCWINAQLGKEKLPDKLEKAIKTSHIISEEHRILTPESFDSDEQIYYANGWFQNADGTVFGHSGSNPNFNSFIKIDCNKDVGVFTVVNCSEPYSDDIHSMIFDNLCGNKTDPVASFNYMTTDKQGTYWTIAGAVIFVIVMILAVTQKKRLAKKSPKMKFEIFRFVVRILLLGLLLTFFIGLPFIFGFNYGMAFLWEPLSLIIALLLTDINIILMLILAVMRLKDKKRRLLPFIDAIRI